MGDFSYYVVEFKESDESIYSIAIKASHEPTKNELLVFLETDMRNFGYDDVFDWYEVDEEEVYVGYYTENIDDWPIL